MAAVGIALTAATGGAASTGHAARHNVLPVLAGTNEFIADSSATMLMRLPRSVRISASDVVVRPGRGRLYGLVLEDDRQMPRAQLESFMANQCPMRACNGFPINVGTFATDPSAADPGGPVARFPAGRYRLYLISDGGRVRVTLRLHELSGRTVARPVQPVDADVLTPTPTQAMPADGPVLFASGSTHVVGRHGVHAYGYVWKDEPLPQEVNGGSFHVYKGEPPAGGPIPAYQNGSNGDISVPFFGGNVSSERTMTIVPNAPAVPYYTDNVFYAWDLIPQHSHPPGRYSIGVYEDTAGPVLAANYVALWINRVASTH